LGEGDAEGSGHAVNLRGVGTHGSSGRAWPRRRACPAKASLFQKCRARQPHLPDAGGARRRRKAVPAAVMVPARQVAFRDRFPRMAIRHNLNRGSPMLRVLSVILLGLLWLAPAPATAADSFDSCTGYIDSLPATISSQGVWCLRGHLSTGISSGDAISINTNNVTIDCNDFKLGGLSAGITTKAYGIHAYDRQNITVRNCSIRGFWIGIDLSGYTAAGHVVRDNRLDNITSTAISVWGPGSTARNNIVRDTGGSPDSSTVYGIFLWEGASAIDNTISGVYAAAGGNGNATGMHCNS